MNELPMATRALIEAAKSEAPSMVARAKIWSGVSAASGIAAAGGAVGVGGAGLGGLGAGASMSAVGTAAVGVGAATGAVGAAKLLVMGALFGSAVTVGLAITLLYVRPAQTPVHAETQVAASVATIVPASMAYGSPPTTATTPPAAIPTPIARTTTTTTATSPRPVAVAAPTEDALMREASLVAEARSALVRGDANAALRAVRAARRLPSHQLEPEELALEAQALRVLGRGPEATAVDGTLRDKYPDHALAR